MKKQRLPSLVRRIRRLGPGGRAQPPAGPRLRPPPWEVRPDDPWLLTDVRIVDVDAGRLRPERALLLRGRSIERLVRPQHLPALRRRLGDPRQFDGRGQFLIPGLVDLHAHIALVPQLGLGIRDLARADTWRRDDPRTAEQRRRNCEQALLHGCTLVRDCGAPSAPLQTLRGEIARGDLLGPRIVSSVGALSPPGGMLDLGRVGNRVGARLMGGAVLRFPRDDGEIVREIASLEELGAEFLKIYLEERPILGASPGARFPMFTPPQLALIREAADRRGLAVAAHSMFLAGSRRAVEGGVDTLEHLPVDAPLTAADADRMVRRSVAVVPTLDLALFYAMDFGPRGFPADEEVRYFALLRRRIAGRHADRVLLPELAAHLRRAIGELGRPDPERALPLVGPVHPERAHGYARHAPPSLAALRGAGVKIGVGTDGGTALSFAGLLEGELAALSRYGFPAPELLRMATLGNLEILGLDERRGRLAPGQIADMVLLGDDPLADAAALGTVARVFRDGRLLVDRGPAPPFAIR